jgi:hypothetical protein
MEMFMGAHPYTAIFRHFYALVGSGTSKREVGAYYFQLRQGISSTYISAFSNAKWEDWRDGWVITTTDANDRLELPMEGPLSDRSTWKAKPSLTAEIGPVLNRVKELANGGLTSLMVLGDFLRRHIAPCSSGPGCPACTQGQPTATRSRAGPAPISPGRNWRSRSGG